MGLYLLAAGLTLLHREGRRRVGGAGLILVGLGVAAGERAAGTGAPPAFLAVNAAVLLLGLGLVAASLVRSGRPSDPLSWGGLLLAAGGVAFLGPVAGPLIQGVPLVAAVLVVASLAGVGMALARVIGRQSRRLAAARTPPEAPARSAWALVGLVTAVSAVAGGGSLGTVLVGGMVVGWAAWPAIPRALRPRPWAPALGSIFFGVSLWFLATVAGPEGLSLAAIGALPLSPAAERLVAMTLLGGAWALFGLWPLRQPHSGALTAPAGAWLLVRVVLPAMAEGLGHWRPAAVPLGLLGLCHGALTRRWSAMAVAGAWLGLVSARPAGVTGAGWLLVLAAGLELERAAAPDALRAWRPALRAMLAILAVLGAFGVLSAGLETEVVYTVLAAGAAAVGLRGGPPGSERSPVALTPPEAGSIFGAETR